MATEGEAAPTPRRRFTLFDGMILVGSVAAALALLRVERFWLDRLAEIGSMIAMAPRSRYVTYWLLLRVIEFVTLPVLMATLTVLAIRLGRPRPPWDRLRCQPGFVAGLAMVPAWAVAGVLAAGDVNRMIGVVYLSNAMLARERPGAWLSALSAAGPGTGGFAVAVAWATLALVGRWEPEASWVDRLGRALGAGWIAMAAFRACVLMGP